MVKIKLTFERGGELIGELNPKLAPHTVKSLIEVLPFDSVMVHTRWCGREFSCGFATKSLPPKENYTHIASKFDLMYWRDWDSEEVLPEAPSREGLCIYYGAEIMNYHGGVLIANVIGHIDYAQEALMEEIGVRIWQHGVEKVTITMAEA